MIKYILSKEFLYAILCTIFIYSVFQRFDFQVTQPSNENMKNVSYQYDDDMNTYNN